ncbi:ROK family protein [Terrarubrum flagellatum]|uniref:ROK family protein n=1 Tax=Terrirubrum flagellatum TaxID=2895980 RepID=UPI0031453EBE
MLIGVDIGGTAVKAGAIDAAGRMLVRRIFPFAADGAFEGFLERVVETCRALDVDVGGRATAIGVCMPGHIDADTGRLTDGGANIAILRERPLAALMADKIGAPVHVANDGVAAAIGELNCGAASAFRRFAMLTLGTGVGGCVALDGQVVTGRRGEPPELGAIVLDEGGPSHGAGRPGSLESFAGAQGFLAAYRSAGGRAAIADPKELFDRIAIDAAAAKAVATTSRRIAQALGGLINALALDGCIVGGGISAAGPALLDPIRAALPDFTWPMLLADVKVVPAALGNDAGVIGAALLAGERSGAIRKRRPAE